MVWYGDVFIYNRTQKKKREKRKKKKTRQKVEGYFTVLIS